jgi:hypothetical protein
MASHVGNERVAVGAQVAVNRQRPNLGARLHEGDPVLATPQVEVEEGNVGEVVGDAAGGDPDMAGAVIRRLSGENAT